MTNILDRFRLDGSIALVTGASFGLGRTMALGLAEAGADVVGISRTIENLAESGADIEALGRHFLPISCDVGDRAALRTAIDAAHGWQSRLDVLVNNAGIIERAPAEVHPDDAWDRVMRINLDAVWIASQAAGVHMLAAGHGKIISTASVLSFSGGVLVPGYTAAKGAVAQLTKGLANEWAARGINVNAIAPGYFVTRNTQALRDDADRSRTILERVPAGRWGDPDDLKGAVVYLASANADYVHGHLLVVDGGWCAR
ncbi:MAG: SDR family NAD(P)-dependent oxidoreductase [Candidatus Latescibacterota bacterium]